MTGTWLDNQDNDDDDAPRVGWLVERWRRWRAKRNGTLGLYDWWQQDKDLRHNGGHVHNVRPS